MYLGSLKTDFYENLRLVHVRTVLCQIQFIHSTDISKRDTSTGNKSPKQSKKTLLKSNIPTNSKNHTNFF